MNDTNVTTSWDDGHALDMRLAELLQRYGVPATFYISPRDRELAPRERLNDAQIKDLSKSFEIGAHTMTHPRLPRITDEDAAREIFESKSYLENIIGSEVASFSYPRGDFLPKHAAMVRDAKFAFARTVERYSFACEPSLAAPTTVHAYDHWSDVMPVLRLAHYDPLEFPRLFRRWDEQAIELFDRAFEFGGTFHLWGHSWEIERNGDWARLERVLRHIADRPGVRYAANGELTRMT